MEKRIAYYDVLRGIAIIGVIAIHSTNIGYKFDSNSWDFMLTVIWRQFINFSVPLFLTISGFFMASKNVESKCNYIDFLKKQLPRVFIPYVLWSLIYSIPLFIHEVSIKTILFRFFTFQTIGPFYYIALIIEFYILLPFLGKMATKKGLKIAGLISCICCFCIFFIRYSWNIDIPLYIYAGIFPTWIVFFVLGLFLRKNLVLIKNRTLVILIIIGFIISILETFLFYTNFNDLGNAVSAVKISSFLYSFFLILFFFKNCNTSFVNMKVLRYLGEISFGVYLSHIIALTFISSFIGRFLPMLTNNAIGYQIVLVLGIIVCCALFALITRKVNKRIAVKYLGQ